MPRVVDAAGDPLVALDEDTRLLYDRVLAEPRNTELRRIIEAPAVDAPCRALRLVLVPGLFYREFPETGADGAFLKSVARALGHVVETIPVDAPGLEGGADTILDWLRTANDGERILLFSLSKGSNEVRHALTRPGAARAFAAVRAWISISGLPFGSRAVDLTLANPLRRLVLRPWCRYKGWSYEHLRDVLRHRPGARFSLPPHLEFVQIAAFPQRRHLRDRRSRRLQRWLAPCGPNDGFALLNELAALPGSLYPVWGADHYLGGCGDLAPHLTALIRHFASRSS